jgi:tetratricopeptide (TPR) repeat protein
MKIPALLFRVSALFCVCIMVSAAVLETNQSAVQSPVASTPAVQPPIQVVIPELDQLQNQLRMVERSNEELQRSSKELQRSSAEASQKFDAVMQQNTALSNVLSGLQETLVNQREKEVQMAKETSAFTFKVVAGAAAAVFLVFLCSYWFQLRCMNRVMEIQKVFPALPSREPALLEQENPASSRLLSAMKMLEHRLEQLETPGHASATSTTNADVPTLLESGGIEPAPSSSMSLLLAKGQVLLDTERLQEAVSCFQEAISVDPTNSEAHLKKGIALERMSRLDQALAAYEEALRLNPKRTVANVYKARVLAALHRYDEAISTYDNALGRNAAKVETPIFAS